MRSSILAMFLPVVVLGQYYPQLHARYYDAEGAEDSLAVRDADAWAYAGEGGYSDLDDHVLVQRDEYQALVSILRRTLLEDEETPSYIFARGDKVKKPSKLATTINAPQVGRTVLAHQRNEAKNAGVQAFANGFKQHKWAESAVQAGGAAGEHGINGNEAQENKMWAKSNFADAISTHYKGQKQQNQATRASALRNANALSAAGFQG